MFKTIKILLHYVVVVPIASTLSLGRTLLVLGLSFSLLISIFIYQFAFDFQIFKATFQDIQLIQDWRPENNSVIFDRDGKILAEVFSNYHKFVPSSEIPRPFIEAVTAIEDQNFWRHNGLDLFAVVRALIHYWQGDGSYSQGASTMTQQVVRSLLLNNEKTIARKLREIVLSLYVEQYFSKEKILEIYANHLFLGNGAYGIGAAAQRYFSKNVAELDRAEWALIAGLFQSPSMYNPQRFPARAKKRQQQVLRAMAREKYIDEKSLGELLAQKLTYIPYESTYGEIAPYFVDYAIRESEKILSGLGMEIKDRGLRIYTTVDQKLSSLASESMVEAKDTFTQAESALRMEFGKEVPVGQNRIEGAILAFERASGKIVAMAGGRDYKVSQFNRAVDAQRSPGSAFKPIVYAMALERGRKWNDVFFISPVTIGNYRPRNSSSDYLKESTMLRAFYKSINSPVITLGEEVGINRMSAFAAKLGVESTIKEEAASLLGGSEVSMMDMARMYSVFANEGTLISPIAISKITTANGEILYQAPEREERSKKVLSANVANLMREGLKQVLISGTGYKARSLSSLAAGKTGTSNQSKDNWFCGFTNDLVVIAWMGNDQLNPIGQGHSASDLAVPLWKKFVEKSVRHLNTKPLGPSKGLAHTRIDPQFGQLSNEGVNMYFLPRDLPQRQKSALAVLDQGGELRVKMR